MRKAYKQDFNLPLSEQVGTGWIDDLVSSSVQNRLDHVEVEIDDMGYSWVGHPHLRKTLKI
jgi:hypothetical protein